MNTTNSIKTLGIEKEGGYILFHALRFWGIVAREEGGKIKITNPERLTDDLKARIRNADASFPVEVRKPWRQRAQEEWNLFRAFQEGVMGSRANELTDADIDRIVALEERIGAAIYGCVDNAGYVAVQELIGDWMVATTPLRWLPHGRWHAKSQGGDGPDTYRSEARLRAVPDSALCRDWNGDGGRDSVGGCGGACTTVTVGVGGRTVKVTVTGTAQ